MTNAKRDENSVTTRIGVLDTDGETIVLLKVNESELNTIDSYAIANWAFSLDYLANLNALKIGMNFQCGLSSFIDSCSFFLTKTGNPQGTLNARLYAITGTYGVDSLPTGSPLAVSDPVNISTIPTAADGPDQNWVFTDYALITFNFSGINRYSMSATNYIVTLEYSGGDNSNYISVGGGDSNLPTGNPVQDYGSGWGTYTGDAYNFYVYGVPVSSGAIKASDGTTGVDYGTVNAKRDENDVPCMMGVSSSDGVTPVAIYLTSNGELLIDSN